MFRYALKRTTLASALALHLALQAMPASALPVLDETKGAVTTDMITLFRDHANPNLYYFLPSSGTIAKNDDGSPIASFAHWGLSTPDPIDGGAYMSVVLRGGLSKEAKAAISEFKRLNPNAQLAVVPIHDSFIRGFAEGDPTPGVPKTAPAIGEAPPMTPVPPVVPATPIVVPATSAATAFPKPSNWSKLISEVDRPPRAGVAETEVGLNMLFTELGARVIKAQLTNGASPFAFSLCYSVRGTTPAMNAEISINYKVVYDHFSASFSGGAWWWRYQIQHVVEELVKNGTISIRILGGDAKLETYIETMTSNLIRDYMVSELENKPETGSSGGRFQFNSTHKEQRTDIKLRLEKQSFIDRDYCTALPLRDLQQHTDKVVIAAD